MPTIMFTHMIAAFLGTEADELKALRASCIKYEKQLRGVVSKAIAMACTFKAWKQIVADEKIQRDWRRWRFCESHGVPHDLSLDTVHMNGLICGWCYSELTDGTCLNCL
jgi:hypothetical protein